MAESQKYWNLHEAVILLEGLLDVQLNNSPRTEVINHVSHDLRNMVNHLSTR